MKRFGRANLDVASTHFSVRICSFALELERLRCSVALTIQVARRLEPQRRKGFNNRETGLEMDCTCACFCLGEGNAWERSTRQSNHNLKVITGREGGLAPAASVA